MRYINRRSTTFFARLPGGGYVLLLPARGGATLRRRAGYTLGFATHF